MLNVAKKIFGSENDRKLKKLRPLVAKINALEPDFETLTDDALKLKTEEFKKRHKDGETLDDLLPEAFAAVREAAKRTLGQRHYDVQLIGGITLHRGEIAEMRTGEGKTLVATLAVYLNALTDRGVHVVTVNDYLASRDAEWMGQVYGFMGLTTGCIIHGLTDDERKAAYDCDVTYGTNNEFGFDYLRDNMKYSVEAMAQRGHYHAIIDEIDSILIDEARTPLIISGPTDDKSDFYRTIDAIIPRINDEGYDLDEKSRQATFNEDGNEQIEGILAEMGLLEGESLYDVENVTVVHHIQQALRAHKLYVRDKDYIVKDDKVVLIDEFTGRMMDGRRLSDGLHQAIEAKENCDIQSENVTLASVTFQNYFRLYEKLSGMTGTAATEAAEFADIYKLEVLEIPTNRPIQRVDDEDEIYRTEREKFNAIVDEMARCSSKGQPMLVGTVSIEKSERLSEFLRDTGHLSSRSDHYRLLSGALSNKGKLSEAQCQQIDKAYRGMDSISNPEGKSEYFQSNIKDVLDKGKLNHAEIKQLGSYRRLADAMDKYSKQGGIDHKVLNARYHDQEAQIVAQAGVPGAITIATNMAGRGTDIQLGGNLDMRLENEIPEGASEREAEKIKEKIESEISVLKKQALDAGGLYVLGTERHESRRIDNQLRGRTGRQGDPGHSKFYISTEDDLMRIFGGDRLKSMMGKMGWEEGESLTNRFMTKAVERAQVRIEQRNFDIRKNVLKYDDVMNDQRKTIFEQRLEFMTDDDVSDVIEDMRHHVCEEMISTYVPKKAYAEQWDIDGMTEQAKEVLAMEIPFAEWAKEEGIADEEMLQRLKNSTDEAFTQLTQGIAPSEMKNAEKQILLQVIDSNWREHLQHLDHLKSVVGLRAHGQRDPLNEYKSEAFTLFDKLLTDLREGVTTAINRLLINVQMQRQQDPASAPIAPPVQAPARSPMDMMSDGPTAQAPEGNPDAQDMAGAGGSVSRNSPCPCGSGKKYKHCHGRVA